MVRQLTLTLLLLATAACVHLQQPQPASIQTLSRKGIMTGAHGTRLARSLLFNTGGISSVKRLDRDAFWAFGADGVHVLDIEGVQLHSISKDSLCKRYESCPRGITPGSPECTWSNDCNWGDAQTDKEYVYATNTQEDKLFVFDISSGILIASIPTCGFPYYIDTAEWRDEVYVHCWRPDSDDEGSVDVFSTGTWGLNHPLATASFNPNEHTHGYITLDVATPNYAYSTNLNDPGVHKIDINTKTNIAFLNLSSVGCSGVGPMAISDRNLHGYLQCYRKDYSSFLVELDLTTDKVVYVHDEVSGAPVVTPDGMMVAVLNSGAGRVHTLRVSGNAAKADDAAVQDILPGFKKGGLSRMAFVQQGDIKVAVLTSTADNFIQVLNMDTFAISTLGLPVPNDGNSSAEAGHGASRVVGAGAGSDGNMYALVAGARMNWLHVCDLGKQGTASEVRVVNTLNNMDGKRIVWAPKLQAGNTPNAAQAGQGSPNLTNSDSDSYKSIAIAALVLAAVSTTIMLGVVAQRLLESRNTGPSMPCAGMPCADQSMAYSPHVDDIKAHEMGGFRR